MYRKFANNLLPSLESGDKDNLLNIVKNHLENNPIQIITFNYDVSLEYYLLRFIQDAYAQDTTLEVQNNIFKEICKTIHHVYGAVREVDFMIASKILKQHYFQQEGQNISTYHPLYYGEVIDYEAQTYGRIITHDNYRRKHPDESKKKLVLSCLNQEYPPVGQENSPLYSNTRYFVGLTDIIESTKDEYKNIKVIGEERNDRIATNVKNLLKTPSEETYILGFGFDKTNSTTILGFDKNGNDKNLHGDIYITNFGNNIRIAKLINKYFGSGLATVSYNSACDALQTEFPLS
jgi:hypothetical protein